MQARLDDPLTERIIGLAMKVHRVLGPGFLESVYRKALLLELRSAGTRAEEEKRISVFYEGQSVGDHPCHTRQGEGFACPMRRGLCRETCMW